jgi:hypothetical protein
MTEIWAYHYGLLEDGHFSLRKTFVVRFGSIESFLSEHDGRIGHCQSGDRLLFALCVRKDTDPWAFGMKSIITMSQVQCQGIVLGILELELVEKRS